ncbi:bZIP transcription factor, partial [Maribacter chungangensis]
IQTLAIAGNDLTLSNGGGTVTINPVGTGNITSTSLTVGGDTNAVLGNITIEIPANSITQGELGLNSVGAGELRSNAVSSDEIDDGTVLNVDIGFGIDGSKIIPDFAAQNIVTTGNINGNIFNAAGIINAGAGINSTGAINLNGIALIPDYVFQKYFTGTSTLNENYTFKSLQEIEAFVTQHQHLPGVQSASEIKKQGYWNLGEASRINLEKIEELFLHTIEQEKKINQLKQANETMASEVQLLKAQMEEIKKMLSAKTKD